MRDLWEGVQVEWAKDKLSARLQVLQEKRSKTMVTLNELRDEVISAFHPENFCYSHTVPFVYDGGFIDGMAWTGILCGAALKAGDGEVAELANKYLLNLLNVGKDARHYAPLQAASDWVESKNMPGFWYAVKPQSFAGPAALRFAVQCGGHIVVPPYLDVMSTAKLYTWAGRVYGALVRYFNPFNLRQHINSIWTAYLITGAKVPQSMLWMCEENPYFSYIAGRKCPVAYPEAVRRKDFIETTEDSVVPLKCAKPSAWVFRRDPYKRYQVTDPTSPVTIRYVRIWQLVGAYLQGLLA